jgi:hypothetical protein
MNLRTIFLCLYVTVRRTATFLKRTGLNILINKIYLERIPEILVPKLLYQYEPKGINTRDAPKNVEGTVLIRVTENCSVLEADYD